MNFHFAKGEGFMSLLTLRPFCSGFGKNQRRSGGNKHPQWRKLMKKITLLPSLILFGLIGSGIASVQDDIKKHPSCPLCGMDRQEYAHSRMLIEFSEATTIGTCSIHCSVTMIALKRREMGMRILVADYNTKKLIRAEKAFWIIGGSKMGVMTKRAKWAFTEKGEALKFIKENGGRLASFDDAMKATFEDMYQDTKMIRDRRKMDHGKMSDIKAHPECKYCGMNRQQFAHSRVLVEYDDGTAIGICSVHCLAIDLALSTGKTPKAIMAGDYYSKRLVDAERASWVLGGKKAGVMSNRGKWAFEEKKDAAKFIKENGGQYATFDRVMKAVFEDMYEILR
jgi:copper chaperone NosL